MSLFSFLHYYCQAENEYHRVRNQELVKLQEESNIRLEQARRATEEKIQEQRRQTEKEKAEIERETIRISEMAGAEARAHEARLSEEVNRRLLLERGDAEREKWISIINTTFEHIGGTLFTRCKLCNMQLVFVDLNEWTKSFFIYAFTFEMKFHLDFCGNAILSILLSSCLIISKVCWLYYFILLSLLLIATPISKFENSSYLLQGALEPF
jgi:hypothetical protein